MLKKINKFLVIGLLISGLQSHQTINCKSNLYTKSLAITIGSAIAFTYLSINKKLKQQKTAKSKVKKPALLAVKN